MPTCQTTLRVLLLLFLLNTAAWCQKPQIKALGIKVNVTDLKEAVAFYVEKIGFTVQENPATGEVLLKSADGAMLLLNQVTNLLPETATEARAGFTLQVNDLDSAIKKMKLNGIDFKDSQKRKEGVGYAITVYDPFDTRISLMHQTIVATAHFQEPQIYNYGVLIPDMKAAREFYAKLGFVERSQKYLPNDMPLGHADGSFAFMLHSRPGIEAVRHNSAHSEHVVLLFQTPDLKAAANQMKEAGVVFLQKQPATCVLGQSLSFYDPFGLVSELIERK